MPNIIIIFLFIFFNITGYSLAKDEYFMTLRHDKVNLRQGPSKDYPIKILYKKKFLPVLIQDSSYNFRKIRDHENNSGWIHISQLTKKKAAIIISDNEIMFNGATIFSNPVAILKKGKLIKINKCKKSWCKAEANDYKGWVKKNSLWGLL
jgi:SH3-like domain-containing protein|tara:strand:- start:38 stop:487 length:450 start_codon:yes stop_codon:yes gene_type:complete